jgi:glycosyltransferase involved in cell wall biosynthesis
MPSRRPQVSVAMASFNGARWLPLQLASILDELVSDDELLVVDDGSSDASTDVVAAVADERVRLLRNSVNRGVRASFERALVNCRGEFIFLADQDDVWLPGKRDALVAELQAGALLAISDAHVIDADGREVEPSFMARRGGFRGGLLATLVKNRFLGCAMAFRRELLECVLPIPPAVPMHDMWIGALASLRGSVAYIDRPLMQYRRHGGNVSPALRASVGQMLTWRWRLLSLVIARRWRGPRPFEMEA